MSENDKKEGRFKRLENIALDEEIDDQTKLENLIIRLENYNANNKKNNKREQ